MLRTLHHPDGTSRQVHLGGWKKQFSDSRDEEFRVKLHRSFLAAPPKTADLRSICSPIEDQGDLGSCTANMLAGLVEANENRASKGFQISTAALPSVLLSNIAVASDGTISFVTSVKAAAPAPTPTPPTPPAPTPTPTPHKLVRASRLFEYYATRKIEGTTREDSGATIRDAVKAAAQYGVVDESLWPYNIAQFAVNPPTGVWTAAATHKVTSYHSITDGDIETMKSVIASGYLIGFGFQVYDYMMSADMASKGFLPLPGADEQLQGGHAVCLCGYDDSKKAFLVRNSWGTSWCVSGYFWMVYDYVANTQLASDFWVVQSAPI
jgi:C1A family cysteine protease